MAAITNDHPFVRQHAEEITGVLSCFDRLILRGHLPHSYPRGLEAFLAQQGILRKDFKTYALKTTERIKTHVKAVVQQAGAPFQHLPKKERMEQRARQLAQDQGLREGIVCAFSCLETCRTFRLQYAPKRPKLKTDYRRCLVFYVYLIHATLGLIHVKLETWFPLTMQVYVNGHEYLTRKLDAVGIAYRQVDNALVWISDPVGAQKCADRFVKQEWPKLLHRLAKQFNPLLEDVLAGKEYYWVVDQAEYATDVLFAEREALASLYPCLVEHSTLCLGAEDVLKFLGRKLHPSFLGEVQSHRGQRVEGTRIKHTMKKNRLKRYDKVGQVLRIETVSNDPREFRVRRERHRKDGQTEMAWQPLCKGVAWLWRYAEVSRTANSRYLEALAGVAAKPRTRELLDRISHPVPWGNRGKRGLQLLSAADQALFGAVLRGEHRLRGFRNQDLAHHLYPGEPGEASERRRRCGQVSRRIQLLRAHGLVAKIPRSRRYRVTAKGEHLMSAAIRVCEKHLPREIQEAA